MTQKSSNRRAERLADRNSAALSPYKHTEKPYYRGLNNYLYYWGLPIIVFV